ncbi:MAG: D-Ala-D-Ala carboxypeptidase family metallohydrolase [Acidobacteriota bacterium]
MQAISYGVTASINVDTTHRQSSEAVVTQDGIDKLRQQYLDMQKNSVPDCGNFAPDRPPTPHFEFSEGACDCRQHQWQLWLIMDNLEAVRGSFGDAMVVNSGYRCPIHNSHQPGAAVNSRHIYGMAADIDVRDFNGDGQVNRADWDILANAATAHGAVLEDYDQTRTWVHCSGDEVKAYAYNSADVDSE